MSEIIETETSYVKGENFEKLFAEYMKSNLGWDGCRVRAQQKGKANSKGAQVDIIAYKSDKRGKNLEKLAIGYLIVMVIGFIWGYLEDEILIMIGGLIFGALALFSVYQSTNLHRENAWVECKNLKKKATYEQVQKCINEFKDYRASGDKEFKYVALYFVSAAGFVENALKLAIDNNIGCYEYKNGKFEKVTYWK